MWCRVRLDIHPADQIQDHLPNRDFEPLLVTEQHVIGNGNLPLQVERAIRERRIHTSFVDPHTQTPSLDLSGLLLRIVS